MSWAEQELKGANLGDKRRNRRLITIVEDLATQPNESVPQASRDSAAVQGAYEFWANPRIKPSEILAAHTNSTVERIKQHSIVLAIQDTTELDFSDHRSKRGMGALSKATAKGLKVHTILAASVQGVPLGVLDQKIWARHKSKVNSERRRAIAAEKEMESRVYKLCGEDCNDCMILQKLGSYHSNQQIKFWERNFKLTILKM